MKENFHPFSPINFLTLTFLHPSYKQGDTAIRTRRGLERNGWDFLPVYIYIICNIYKHVSKQIYFNSGKTLGDLSLVFFKFALILKL